MTGGAGGLLLAAPPKFPEAAAAALGIVGLAGMSAGGLTKLEGK